MANDKQTFNTKLFECCSEDVLRPDFQCIYFIDGFAYATNSHVMVKQSIGLQSVINPEVLEGKLLHKDSFKACMGFETVECTPDGMACSNLNGQVAFFEYYNTDKPTPDFNKMIPTKDKFCEIGAIGLNPDMLVKVTKALYCPNKTFRMRYTGNATAIVIDVIGEDDQIAIIMPIPLMDSLFS